MLCLKPPNSVKCLFHGHNHAVYAKTRKQMSLLLGSVGFCYDAGEQITNIFYNNHYLILCRWKNLSKIWFVCHETCAQRHQPRDDSTNEEILEFKSRDFDVRNSSPPVTSSACDACSGFFFPLPKIQLIFEAAVVVAAWLFMFHCALRLLWLRKYSSNVFVRHSAFWRFLLFTAIFYLITTAPFLAICCTDIFDFFKKSPYLSSKFFPSKTILLVNASLPTLNQSNDNTNSTLTTSSSGNFYLCLDALPYKSSYLAIASSLLLLHCSVTPLLYLFRLLGIRRIISTI